MVKVGINGLGRIGRLALRIALLKHSEELEVTAINTSGSMSASDWAFLVNHDTMYREFEKEIKAEGVAKPEDATDDEPLIGHFMVDCQQIAILTQRDPEKIPWGEYGVDVVIESTGKFITEFDAMKHAKGGAKRVIISAPGKGENVATYVLGVNEYKGEGQVISNASCTTNCIAPVASVMHSQFGILKAMMTTIHGYTDDQRLQDNSHSDLRRARAAAANIIPTTTGAAVATTETIPELVGLFDGRALRVPVLTGSITDFTILVKRKVSVNDINDAFKKAAENPIYKGILAVTDEPIE